MAYANQLSKKNKVAWEQFKRNCCPNNEHVIQKATLLGNCNVSIGNVKGQLYLEIMPNETADFDTDIAGILVNINENDCHVDSIMTMAKNAHDTEKAKLNKKPLKIFVS